MFRLQVQEVTESSDLGKGLKYLKVDGVFSQLMGVLISSSFITPMLLLFGANSFYVGIYSTIVALSTFSQLLSIFIVNKVNGRKSVSIAFSLFARFILLLLAIHLMLNMISSLTHFLLFILAFYFVSNISSGAFKYWMLDFVPRDIRGRYFASRTRISLLIGSFVGLLAALYVDFIAGNTIRAYEKIILAASLFGLAGMYFLVKIPEPKFEKPEAISINSLKHVLRSNDLKRHFEAIFFVYLALNLSLPFFIYYMLVFLGFSISIVFILTIVGQLATVFFLPKWGFLIDKYGVKPVLKLTVRILVLVLLLWPFTTLPQKHALSLFIVLIIYILVGVALGGLNLSSSLIAYYLVRDKRDNFVLSLNDIFISLGTVIGSFLGALISIPTSYMELSLTFNISLSTKIIIYIVDLQGLDFIFVLSSLLGIASLSLFTRYKVDNNICLLYTSPSPRDRG